MFGELIGIWLISTWKMLGSPSKCQIVELGPGRGTLMSDVLRTVDQFKYFQSSLEQVHMVEASPFLRRMQAKALCGSQVSTAMEEPQNLGLHSGVNVSWHDSLSDVPTGNPTFIIAHEFFDALPVYQFEKSTEGWREVMIDVDESVDSPFNFRFVRSPGPTKASVAMLNDKRYDSIEPGFRVEVCPEGYAVAYEIAKRMKADGGAALIADYGKNVILGDSLRGIRNHQFVSPLSSPGDVDLSADVDFSLLAKAASDAGATPHGLMTQADFLRCMGIVQRLQSLLAIAAQEKRKELAHEYERLVGTAGGNGMGEVYKFMCISSQPSSQPPYPFSDNDQKTNTK
ncbi:hypothetical protein HDU76_010814 [Blyttiomyces sp. JEL0837]|nr:hypothetical protein HDU76_010814 [Blyttiomyces sp. JEL0837]